MSARPEPEHDRTSQRANLVLLALAGFYFLIEWLPGFTGSYRYFIDEFYYLACADHLAFGYVDHPPLSVGFLWIVRGLIGDSLPVLRLFPALAGALTILATGLLARRLGANAFGQALAAGAAMIGSIYHVMFSFYSMNAFSILFWIAAFWILIEIERRDEPRLWLVFGALTGLGLENKHTFILLLIGLAVGILLTKARHHLMSRWLWLGALIAAVLVLPNLIWQTANGWPSIEFYRNADLYKNVPTPPLEVLKQQILMMNPGAMVVWVAGLWFFLAAKAGRPYRHLGWIYVVLLVLMLVGQKSRPDRISEAYTVLFAGGGVWLGNLIGRPRLGWLRWVLPVILLLTGLALAPVGLTVLPPEAASRYAATLGLIPQIEKGEGKRTDLPQWMADRLGWEQFVDDIESVVKELDPAERDHAVIVVPTYGQAGSLEMLGRGRGLPPVYAGQNSYWHWGPPPGPVDVAIVAGPFPEEMVYEFFSEVTMVRLHDCDWCMPWRDGVPIWIARNPKVAFREVWPNLRFYE